MAFGYFDDDEITDVFSTKAIAGKWAYSSGGNGPWIPLATSAIELPDLAFGYFDDDEITDVFSTKAIAGKWAYSSGGNAPWAPLATSGVPVDRLKVGYFDEEVNQTYSYPGQQGVVFIRANHSWQLLRDSDVRLSQIGLGDFNGDGITDVFTSRGASYQPSRTIDLTVSIWRPVNGADQAIYEEIFEYFADAVYEMSNGAHAIGTITIYQNGENASTADVLWQESQWPRTRLAGINNASIPVIMGDVFPFPMPYDALVSGNRVGSGYTLAHEWGHYYYGMLDEYANSSTDYDDIPSSPHSDDEPTPDSVMNYHWAATSGGDALSWLNFSIRKNNMIDSRLRRTAPQ